MTPRAKRRLWIILALVAGCTLGAFFLLSALRSSIVFFQTPSDIVAQPPKAGQALRLGGLVVKGSVHKLEDGLTTEFAVTDTKSDLVVRYKGILPDLFREGQGVVAQGSLSADHVFIATQVLAKHDENYRPPELKGKI